MEQQMHPLLSSLGSGKVGEEVPTDWMKPHDFGRSFEGSAQAISLGRESLCGASDPRLDGIATGL
jgi:gamma-glutamyltranspeptidase